MDIGCDSRASSIGADGALGIASADDTGMMSGAEGADAWLYAGKNTGGPDAALAPDTNKSAGDEASKARSSSTSRCFSAARLLIAGVGADEAEGATASA